MINVSGRRMLIHKELVIELDEISGYHLDACVIQQ